MFNTTEMINMIVQGFCIGLGGSLGNYFILKVLLSRLEPKEKPPKHA